ncbi:hypothetical protein TELCIR_01100 [Teladorsagia circumcincta]|uniref:Reverse transcriptase domain-containing protein n=1 Tax=Teladorsagia circumcincta TaxID=45464 RepID=A0A2G9V4A5_TELCI|nr:hypothetical protein TELCIR_01100 [Teladorsagia circumcincta]
MPAPSNAFLSTYIAGNESSIGQLMPDSFPLDVHVKLPLKAKHNTVKRMLNDLHAAGLEAGLNINMNKTKCMRNEYTDRGPVLLQGVSLEDVDEYVYLGRILNMKDDLKGDSKEEKSWLGSVQFYQKCHRKYQR